MNQLPECLKTELLDDEIDAIRAVAAGRATEYQQRLAIASIVQKIARYGDLGFVPGSPDETAFFNGRQFVGTRIMRIINDE